MLIEKLKERYKPRMPIYTKDILSLYPSFTKAYVFRLIDRCIKDGQLIKFSRGVYCIPSKSVFGDVSISSFSVATNKYITNGEDVYGFSSGLSLLNRFSISSQVPNVIEIITNNEATRKRTVTIDGSKYVLRKSRFQITKYNYSYYIILQLFLDLGVNPKIDDFAKQRIKEYIDEQNIEQETLFKLAMKFPAQALKNLIGSEIINVFIKD